jgi:hypothetical protein
MIPHGFPSSGGTTIVSAEGLAPKKLGFERVAMALQNRLPQMLIA